MTTSPTIRYNRSSEQAERVPVFCDKTGKLLTRIAASSIAQLVDVPGGQWCWCKGCHMEHYILWSSLVPKEPGEK